MPRKKPDIFSKLDNILAKIEFPEPQARNELILRLGLGLDGSGTRTLAEIKKEVDAAYPDVSVSTERIRIVKSSLEEAFAKIFAQKWDGFWDSLMGYTYSLAPIEVNLLSKRIEDPSFESFSPAITDKIDSFSNKPFHYSGLLKLLDYCPKPYKNESGKECKLSVKRIYFHATKDETTHQKGRSRNSKDCMLFLTRSDKNSNLYPLLVHAEKAIQYNGMVQEQVLVPLISKELPVYHREELAHSIFANHKDFLWLDEHKGYLTLTNNLDNRISRCAAKIFSIVDSVHLDLFANQISRSVRAQTRTLRGESKAKDLKSSQETTSFLTDISYSSDRPFTVKDAALYFRGTGLCTIDKDNIVRPTELLWNKVPSKPRWSELVMVDTLKEHACPTLSKSDFQARSIENLAQTMKPKYKDACDRIIKAHSLAQGNKLLVPEDMIEILFSKTRSALESKKEKISNVRDFIHFNFTGLVSSYVERRKALELDLATKRTSIRNLKAKGSKGRKLAEEEREASLLRLLLAEFSDFSNRTEALEKEHARLERSIAKFVKANNKRSKYYLSEQENIKIVESHQDFIAFFLDENQDLNAQVKAIAQSLYSDMFERVKSELDPSVRTQTLEAVWFNFVENLFSRLPALEEWINSDAERVKFSDFTIYQVLKSILATTDDLLTNLGEPNDKFEELFLNLILTIDPDQNGNRSMDLKEFESNLEYQALEKERHYAVAHFTYNISYSPLVVRIRNSEYSYVGSDISNHREV